MNEHNITNESLALAMMLVVVAILISHKEKLALEKIFSGAYVGRLSSLLSSATC